MNREQIAQVAHEVNRAYAQSLGDENLPAWPDAPQWQRDSALAGVDMHLANPEATPEQSHESWLDQKVRDGWVYGEIKDAEKKIHPCCVPYDQLPAAQKSKDYLFRGVVHSLAALPVSDSPPAEEKAPPAAASGLTGVKYIGRHETYGDALYGSGSWVKGQVKGMPEALARRLLKHEDSYARAKVPRNAQIVRPVDASGTDRAELDQVQDLQNQVAAMSKDALREFAKSRYGRQIDGRLSEIDIRGQVSLLVDQFGIQ